MEAAMKFTLLLYGDESQWADATPEELAASMARFEAFDRELTAAGVLAGGEGLEPSSMATSVRRADGEVMLTDGPFAETREQLGGFYVLDCADLDEAIRWASKMPELESGTVEIRPVIDYEAAGG
jgi:hypothetical protein